MVLPQASHKQVVKTIIIVIAGGDSHSPAHVGETGLVGHVGKSPIAVVAIKSAASFTRGLHQIHCQRVNEKDIRIAVVIVVKKRNSATHRLIDVLLIGRGHVLESNMGRSCDLAKHYRAALATSKC